jgi:hypothetical protein
LVTALRAVNQDVAAKLAAEMAPQAPKPTQVAAPPPLSGAVVLELAIAAMADELDLPPRRIRGAIVRLLKRLNATSFTLESLQQQIEARIASSD